ncbi:MAG: Holliday junction resolvase RuvX [bacterium]
MSSTAEQLEYSYPLLGLDVSETHIGVAVCDGPGLAAQELFTLIRLARARDLQECATRIAHYEVAGVVLGLPLNMDGSEGERVQWMRRFARELQRLITVPIYFQDERLSTVEAEALLHEQGIDHQTVAERVDATAAAIILDRFTGGRA